MNKLTRITILFTEFKLNLLVSANFKHKKTYKLNSLARKRKILEIAAKCCENLLPDSIYLSTLSIYRKQNMKRQNCNTYSTFEEKKTYSYWSYFRFQSVYLFILFFFKYFVICELAILATNLLSFQLCSCIMSSSRYG